MSLTFRLTFCALLLLGSQERCHSGEYDSLLAKVPGSANVIVLIDVERTLASPLAQKEGWGKQLELAYVERPVFLPPEATRLVLSADFRPSVGFDRLWELGLMELSEPISARSIARSEGGYVDEINGVEAVWTPSDAYFLRLSEQYLGVLFPAERQFVSRWVDFARKNQTVVLSDYLQQAAQLTSDQIQILLAIDLTDVVRPDKAQEEVEDSALFQQAKLGHEQVVPLLTSLQGATLRIAVGQKTQAQLKIDFGKDLDLLRPIAKELVLSVLNDLGANIGDLSSWKVEVRKSSILLEGELSRDGTRRVLSIVELPSAKFSELKNAAEQEQPGAEIPESQIRESSLTYFRSIDVLTKDLRHDLQGNKASAAVMERYARKIDRMPILHVDSELLDFGSGLSQLLRSMALAKRQGGIDYGVSTAGMGGGGYTGYTVGYGYYGNFGGDLYAGARASAADRAAIKAESMAAANQSRVEGFKSIDDATAAIRRKMTEKYQVEF